MSVEPPTEPPPTRAASGQTSPEADGRAAPAEAPPEEVERWWGAFSGWTMTPSFLVCVVLTALIGWAAWMWVPRGWVKVSVVGASSVVWLVQLVRWAARALGKNYRLTTRRLWVTHGIRRRAISALELSQVGAVMVEQTWLERRLGVGRVCVAVKGGGWPMVLEGVAHPGEVAARIRETVQAASCG